jgi:signal peptidase
LTKRSFSRGIIKDILIIAVGVIVIWVGLQIAFGTQNPFYVVASGSMIPNLLVYDVLIVQGHEPFEDIQVGDIIVFNRPSDHDRVIVHRVASIIDDDPKTIRTKGDANPASIPGTDFPITEKEYIGKVAYVIPQIGYVTQILKPPTNYIIIAIVIGIMIVKQMSKKKKEKELTFEDPFGSKNESDESSVEIPGLEKLKKDDEYSKHNKSSDEDSNNTKEFQKDKE